MVIVALVVTGLFISLLLAIYQAVEARRIEKMLESIAEFDYRYNAIYQAWRSKHPIMPYSGPSVAWFIGLFGFFIPVGACTLLVMLFG